MRMKPESFIGIFFLFISFLLGGCVTAPYDKWMEEVKLIPQSQPPLPKGVSSRGPTDPPSRFQIGCEGDWDPQNGMWVCILSRKGTQEIKPVPWEQPPLPEGVSRNKKTAPPSRFQIGTKGEWEPRNGMWVGVPTPPPKKQETFSGSGGGPCYGYGWNPLMPVPWGWGSYPFMTPWYGSGRFC